MNEYNHFYFLSEDQGSQDFGSSQQSIPFLIFLLPPFIFLQLFFPHTNPALHCPLPLSQSPSPFPHGELLVQHFQLLSAASHFAEIMNYFDRYNLG